MNRNPPRSESILVCCPLAAGGKRSESRINRTQRTCTSKVFKQVNKSEERKCSPRVYRTVRTGTLPAVHFPSFIFFTSFSCPSPRNLATPYRPLSLSLPPSSTNSSNFFLPSVCTPPNSSQYFSFFLSYTRCWSGFISTPASPRGACRSWTRSLTTSSNGSPHEAGKFQHVQQEGDSVSSREIQTAVQLMLGSSFLLPCVKHGIRTTKTKWNKKKKQNTHTNRRF